MASGIEGERAAPLKQLHKWLERRRKVRKVLANVRQDGKVEGPFDGLKNHRLLRADLSGEGLVTSASIRATGSMWSAISKNGHSPDLVSCAHKADRRMNSRMSATRERVRSNAPTQSTFSSLSARAVAEAVLMACSSGRSR
ncbi:hypothetical protein HUT19_30010 [Streptomyces sp. NA02950]|uniref:hypothetical protein n=1 Tax=Streptomyces sp. NA02950 TaxID=2742137 RepID=UPI001590B028|nr:hypothetical protein [Streptomyces sp. NA02950]QKV95445.1 hypothetical protein HUT19_30010 [Streptomyces sp. NA02950]